MKKTIVFVLALFSAALIFSLAARPAAAAEPLNYSFTEENASLGRLKDGKLLNAGSFETATIRSETEIDSLYFLFNTKALDMTLSAGGEEKSVEGKFLHRFVKISELFSGPVYEVTVRFPERAVLNEVCAFGKGDLPDWVQVWEDPCEKADLMLFTTHADDEQLFFAGVLPTYAGERGLAVQVAYFTDHVYETDRRHELLNGLWTVGVTHYPVIGSVPDAYAQSDSADAAYNWALQNAKTAGFTEESLIASQTELLRRFKPLVVVGHDLNGEYHHGQHILNVRTLLKAAEGSGQSDFCAESAEKYGTWDVKKVYLHLYSENAIVMDWDQPLSAFGGKTAFQMTQAGFACHNSQQGTWFGKWIYGANGQLSRAADVSYVPPVYSSYTSVAFSPCRYGLYRTTVGEDVKKNDFMENIETYEEEAARLRREEEERLAREREEEERLRREAEEAEQARLLAEQKDRELEEAKRTQTVVTIVVTVLALPLLILLILLIVLIAAAAARRSRRRTAPEKNGRGNGRPVKK